MAAIEDALWENGGELTEELEQALAETEQSLVKKTDGYISLLQSLAAQESIMKAQKERYAKLEKIAANAQKRLREHLDYNMSTFGIEKLEGMTGKISRTKSTAVEVNEEQMLDPYLGKIEELRVTLPAYITLPDPKVSKAIIKQMNKETGVLPAGAEIVENYSIRIR
jgi:hypothetical protein